MDGWMDGQTDRDRSTTLKNVFLILTSTELILMIFIEPEFNHQFRASSFGVLARFFFGRGFNVGYHD